ncbi:MAG: TRAP transporter small permease [Proteobacteria bacterium]|nr:TRAP transporter small permease [Pseudomonadota bacterium]
MNRVLQGWNRVEKFIAGLLALSATSVAFYAVIMRYAFNNPPDWGEEIATYLLIWAVFIIASTLVEERGHVGATILVERFPLKVRRPLAVLNALLALGFCLLIAFFGYKIVSVAHMLDERSLTALRFPLWIPYLAVPAGLTLIIIRYGIRVCRLLFFFDPSQIMEIHEMSREDKHS